MKDREKETIMNHWLIEELTRLTCDDRQRKLDTDHLLNDFNALQANWTFTSRVALKLSDWLIASGETLRRRYDKNPTVSPWLETRKFAR
jgi:hypothetical protein